jgi:hypothetical protein
VQLTFDTAEDLRWTIAFDVADDRHSGANARACSHFPRRLPQAWSYGCTILRMTSVAFADAFLSFSGALLFMLFNMSTSFFSPL